MRPPQRALVAPTAPKNQEGGSDSPKKIQQGKKPPSRSSSPLEEHLLLSIRASGLPEPEREYRFHSTRRWRLDFCWPERGLAVEVEGGVYRGGGHTSVAGLKRDLEKGNALTMLGWRLLRFHGDQVRSGEAASVIAEALAQRWVREV